MADAAKSAPRRVLQKLTATSGALVPIENGFVGVVIKPLDNNGALRILYRCSVSQRITDCETVQFLFADAYWAIRKIEKNCAAIDEKAGLVRYERRTEKNGSAISTSF